MWQPQFLYIEDHPASRRVMELLLTEIMDFTQLTMLEDTQDVVHRLEGVGHPFDIIFLDVNLKPHDGYEVCIMLRSHPVFGQAKIIGLTGEASPSEMRKMQESGFDGVIGKPLSHVTFPGQVQRILAGESVWEAI